MKTIKFTKPNIPYIEGDIATFNDDVAKQFIEKEIAVEFKKKNNDGGNNDTDKKDDKDKKDKDKKDDKDN